VKKFVDRVLGSTLLPALSFVMAFVISGFFIAFSDSKVLKLASSPGKFVTTALSTVGNAYLALFQGSIYDPNLAEGHGFLHGLYLL
jgi:simple sugar transport system permease protein